MQGPGPYEMGMPMDPYGQPMPMNPYAGDMPMEAYNQGMGPYGAGAHMMGPYDQGMPMGPYVGESQGYAPSKPVATADGRATGGSTPLSKRKSFSGPESGEAARSFRRLQSGRTLTRKTSGVAKDSLARNGSLFQMNRERDTQTSISIRGGFDREEEVEELREYYGDMATREETRKTDGLQIKKSYRGDINDGSDVGKPRRVTERRNVAGKSTTGYGGLHFKRDIAMRKGELWGAVDVRQEKVTKEVVRDIPVEIPRHNNEEEAARRYAEEMRRRQAEEEERMRQMMMQQMLMEQEAAMLAAQEMAMMDQPIMPMVFQKQDVRTYSNLTDAFSEGALPDTDEGF